MEGGQTEGVILLEISGEELQILDWFEGDEYRRQSVTVQCDHHFGETPQTPVQTYIWNNALEELDLEQEWDYQQFCLTTLKWYLANTVRPCRGQMDKLGIGKK
jgi:hypothetical protein